MKHKLRHPLDSIRDALVKPSAFNVAKERCLMAIDTIFRIVKDHPVSFFDPPDFKAFQLKVQPLSEDTGLLFFRPWTIERLRSHPILLSDPDVASNIRVSREGMDFGPPSLQQFGYPLASRVEILENVFMHEAQTEPRSGPEGDNESLTFITGWAHLEGYTPRFEAGTMRRRVWEEGGWACNEGWARLDERAPHFKAIMFTVLDGNSNEEQLLRGEVLVILGIMAERLRLEELKKHIVIPVMLFSFMGPRHGRILISYFDGRELVIRKSQLCQFTSHDVDSIELFVRYHAAEIGAASTTRLPYMGL